MPVIVVYDDAKALTFGTAYISDDAYESPLSLMTFDRATVEKANRAEFDDFRQNGLPNVVTRSAYHSGRTPPKRLEEMGIQEGIGMARHCDTYARFSLMPIARELLKEYWPQERPRYWAVPTKGTYLGQNGWAVPQEIKNRIDRLRSPEHPNGVVRRDDGEGYGPLHNNGEWQSQDFIVDSGVIRNIAARSRIGPPVSGARTRNPTLYPARSDIAIRRQFQSGGELLEAIESRTADLRNASINVDDGRFRGFAYCWAPLTLLRNGQKLDTQEIIAKFSTYPSYSTVDGVRIQGSEENLGGSGPSYIYERDEFVFVRSPFFLESVGGDV